jgi:DNA-binding protein H-NS
MAKTNGRLTEKAVREWFSGMDFQAQRDMLAKLNEAHNKVRQVRINALKRELVMLESGSSNGNAARPAKTAKKRKASIAVKYRDPKSGATWSGRGRMASWLAKKIEAGEKVEKYLV